MGTPEKKYLKKTSKKEKKRIKKRHFLMTSRLIECEISTQNNYEPEKMYFPSFESGQSLKSALSNRLKTAEKFRLLYRGRSISDETILGEICPEKELKMEIYAITEEKRSAAYSKVNNVRILKRNVDACADCARHGLNPRERERFNHPKRSTHPAPDTEYFGEVLVDLGETFENVSQNLKVLAETLKRGEDVRENREKYEKNRRIIQNNMDCLRYSNPMLINLTKLKIPVNKPKAMLQVANSNEQALPVRREPLPVGREQIPRRERRK